MGCAPQFFLQLQKETRTFKFRFIFNGKSSPFLNLQSHDQEKLFELELHEDMIPSWLFQEDQISWLLRTDDKLNVKSTKKPVVSRLTPPILIRHKYKEIDQNYVTVPSFIYVIIIFDPDVC